MRVTKGIDAMSIKTRIAGDKASKNGLLMSKGQRLGGCVDLAEEV